MFNWLNNMRMGRKLLTVILGLVFLIGGVMGVAGYLNLMSAGNVINEITDQRIPSVKNATAVERYALRTIMDEKLYLLASNDVTADADAAQRSAMANIDQIILSLDEVDKVATQFNDQDLLVKSSEVRTVTLQYKELYNQGVASLQENKIQVEVMVAAGTKVVDLAKAYYQVVLTSDSEEAKLALPIVVNIWDTALQTRLDQNRYMLFKDIKYHTSLEVNLSNLVKLYNDLDEVTSDPENSKRIDDARAATDEYAKAAATWYENDKALTNILGQMNVIGLKVQENAIAAEDAGWLEAEGSKATAAAILQKAIILTIVVLVIALLMGLASALIVSRSITKPLAIVVDAAKALSIGDTQRDLDEKTKDIARLRKDELGDIGKAFDDLINYMQEMGAVAKGISDNDLTMNVHAKSETDELGNAFSLMVNTLRESITTVSSNTAHLLAASEQLASAAQQAGLATTQISTTIQQVAMGTQNQAGAVTQTATSVEEMSRAITGVAKGAQEQTIAVSRAAEITEQINNAIQQVSGNAAAVTRDSAMAAEAARKGSKTVEETLEGMQNIKTKVGLSAEKVKEMGIRSEQIGTIVEVIEDIASQTNLLALNAAIEAARAGEHGKGFAVVADEVRKLAERSSSATKEIGGLISGIQKTVAEAVKAMDEGTKEVEAGVKSANLAGTALSEILNAAEEVNNQAKLAGEASARMSEFSDELVAAVDSVSAVVEENTAATEEMAANSTQVTQAIEVIASVSEENSASIEEVSASTEEMSAQVEEVTASAVSLAEMTRELRKVCSKYKIDGDC
jgi:methyl-accepting chemotaxis protein